MQTYDELIASLAEQLKLQLTDMSSVKFRIEDLVSELCSRLEEEYIPQLSASLDFRLKRATSPLTAFRRLDVLLRTTVTWEINNYGN